MKSLSLLLLVVLSLSAQTEMHVTCSVDGRAEVLHGEGGRAANFPGCGHIICDRHVKWIRKTSAGWWLFWDRELVPRCPVDGWVPGMEKRK